LNHYAHGPADHHWLAPGVRKHHRITGPSMNSLIDAGFVIRRVIEWSPTAVQISADPNLAGELDRPMFLRAAVQRSRFGEARR